MSPRPPGNPGRKPPGSRAVGQALAHDSAMAHVTGAAEYVDDIPEPAGCLHVAPGFAGASCGQVQRIDTAAAEAVAGVVMVLQAHDIPGVNDVSPTHSGDDLVLSATHIGFHGQVVAAAVADSYEAARRAARLIRVAVAEAPPLVSLEQALAAATDISPAHTHQRGDPDTVLASVQAGAQAGAVVSGALRIGGQDHFYLEGQVSLAIPHDDGGVSIYCSSQHPSEVQHVVAGVLGVPASAVSVVVRRMGGGFGGKESQANQWAALAALAAVKTGRAAKCRLDRDDDMILTGKRHDFLAQYRAAFAADGRIRAVSVDMAARCGASKDLSDAVVDRAMFHAANAYYWPQARICARRMRTHTVSNTAFRGFGGPQGMMVGEWIIERIARATGQDPLDVRRRNLYGRDASATMTPYFMKMENFTLPQLMAQLEESSQYRRRRAEIAAFNAHHTDARAIRRGLALTPVCFGISFTTGFLNQAGALVHIYKDGSILLNHGGTEMGQGLYIKIAQVVAEVFAVDVKCIRISAAHTAKVPNTSATAASSGTDINGMAARNAAGTLRRRLCAFAANHFALPEAQIKFADGQVQIGNRRLGFAELAGLAYRHRVHLSATGFYRTPKIDYDRTTARGRPFYYFAGGAAVAEVAIDTMSGETRVLAVDILHDVGRSLNPAVDRGQIEGGFVQGMGWLTSEELVWNDAGHLLTHAPSTYKIPTAGDVPARFRVALWQQDNAEATIYRSKAVGEPPLMLAISVFHAIADAISSLSDYRLCANLSAPATPEAVLMAVNDMRARAAEAPAGSASNAG